LNEKGGVIDDLIVYYISPTHYRLIVNASRTAVDFAWIRDKANQFSDKNIEVKLDQSLAIIAVQGPLAVEKLTVALETYPHLWEIENKKEVILNLKPFHFIQLGDFFIARTGYTGEKGFEIMLPADRSIELWENLSLEGVRAIGLGARDTLRLEAGFNLYGQDMNEAVTPLESNLQWTVSFEPKDRNFIGRQALEAQLAQGLSQKLVGIKLLDKGVLRPLQNIIVHGQNVGIITSGTFSPTLKQSIGLARIQYTVEGNCLVHIRDKSLQAQIVVPPFVRREKI
jgi:aminomethyltransferase